MELSLNVDELINELAELCRNEDIRISCRDSAIGGVVTGIATCIGGLLLGRTGLLLGASIGAATSVLASTATKPAAQVIMELPQHKKQKLYRHVKKLLQDHGIEFLSSISIAIMANQPVKISILKLVDEFLQREMNLPTLS